MALWMASTFTSSSGRPLDADHAANVVVSLARLRGEQRLRVHHRGGGRVRREGTVELVWRAAAVCIGGRLMELLRLSYSYLRHEDDDAIALAWKNWKGKLVCVI